MILFKAGRLPGKEISLSSVSVLLCLSLCCGSGFIESRSGYGSRSSISSESGSGYGSRFLIIRNVKITAEFLSFFFCSKFQFTDPWASIKDGKATGEAVSPQKRTFSISKAEIY
jgi:hypothetical protein